jgi:hypothetical protein
MATFRQKAKLLQGLMTGATSYLESCRSSVTCFVYPHGHWNDRIRELVREHFLCGCSDKFGLVTARSDLYSLERIDACYFRTDRLFGIILTGCFPSYIWVRNIPLSVRRVFQKNS